MKQKLYKQSLIFENIFSFGMKKGQIIQYRPSPGGFFNKSDSHFFLSQPPKEGVQYKNASHPAAGFQNRYGHCASR